MSLAPVRWRGCRSYFLGKETDVNDPKDMDTTPYSDASHLCDDCKNIGHMIRQIWEANDTEYTISTGRTGNSVEERASTCALCALILEAAARQWKSSTILPEFWEDTRTLYVSSPRPYLYVSSIRPYDGSSELYIRYSLHTTVHVDLAVLTMEGSPAAANVSGRCIKPASDLGCARTWLQDCLKHHDHGANMAASRPARLIAAGTEDGAEPIVLVDGSTIDQEFLALSHCWGKSATLRTTRATLSSFQTSILWDQLPKTFQDALQVTRDLGVGYIWIDSLCIVQDDSDDWDTESAKMADIYNSALLTIMAASASDSQGGCFRSWPSEAGTIPVPYTDDTGTTTLCVYASHAPLGYNKTISEGPLFQRAWIFQERLLSKRRLIFGDDQTYWHCDSLVLPESRVPRRSTSVNSFKEFSDSRLLSFKHNSEWRFLWHTLVQNYSECSLTFETDRLPSLSGLAQIFADRSNHSYAAGLWLEHMPLSLLWLRGVPLRMDQKREYCAPSWSWASIEGPCGFPIRHGVPQLEIMGVNIKLASTDPYGRVAPGSSITVKGRVRAARLTSDGNRRPTLEVNEENAVESVSVYLDQERGDLPLNITCLEIHSGVREIPFYNKSAQYIMLVATMNDMEFRRIGHVICHNQSMRKENYMFFGIEKSVIKIL